MTCKHRCGMVISFGLFLTIISQVQSAPTVMDQDGYILNWVVCGPFPLEVKNVDPGQKEPVFAYNYDFLAEKGGEEKIQPVDGMAVPCKSDHSTKKWKNHLSKTYLIDFNAIYGLSQQKIAYAYTQLDLQEAFPGILAVGSDDGIKVWLNGKVVIDRHVLRGLTKDEDKVPVEFKKGKNDILVKVENGKEDFCFCVRALASKKSFSDFCKNFLALRQDRSVLVSEKDAVKVTVVTPDFTNGRYQADLRVQVTDPAGKTKNIEGKYKVGDPILITPTKSLKGTYNFSIIATGDSGQTTLTGFFHFLPDMGGEIQKWQRAIADIKPVGDNGLPAKVSANLSVRMIALQRLCTTMDNPEQAKMIPIVLNQMTQIFDHYQKGNDYFKDRPGNFLKAYRSEQDNSIQPYTISVPKSYDPKKKHPMIINLHGNGAPSYNKEHVILSGCGDLGVGDNEFGIINVYPYGRGNYGYLLLGEDDVLRVMDEVIRDYKIDETRVYIRGFSLGGVGAFSFGAKFPHRFAAISSSGGPCDSRLHNHGDYWDSWQIPDVIPVWGTIFLAENYLHVPNLIHQGGSDPVVKTDHARNMTARLKELGYNVEYFEHPGAGHADFSSTSEADRWLLRYKIDPYPRHVVYKTINLRHNRAYWVTINQCLDATSFAKIDVRVTGPNFIDVSTQNIRQFSLDLNPSLVDFSKPLTVQIDMTGSVVLNPKFPPNIALRKLEYEWVDFTGKALKGLYKHHGIQGPIRDAYSTKFIYVYGTIGEEKETKMNSKAATEECNSLGGPDWRQVDGDYVVKKDVEITDDDIRTANLILVGRPSSNKITNQIHAKLPIRLEGNTLHAPGPLDGKDAIVRFIYPNPLNPDRYVVIVYAVNPEQLFPYRGVPWGTPDFSVSQIKKNDKKRPNIEPVRIGFFDVNWRFPPEETLK